MSGAAKKYYLLSDKKPFFTDLRGSGASICWATADSYVVAAECYETGDGYVLPAGTREIFKIGHDAFADLATALSAALGCASVERERLRQQVLLAEERVKVIDNLLRQERAAAHRDGS